MEGRDIGTNVFPDAEVKVFLTARPEVRAARRAAELRAKGEDVDEAEVLAALIERDRRDSEREVAPLRKAEDAVEVDTSGLTLDEVVDAVVAVVGEKVPSMKGPWGYPLRGIDETGLYTFLRWMAVPFFGGVYRCRVSGAEHLPRTGPAMVAMTHKCFWDPVIAGMIFDRPLRYMAKKELFANEHAARFISSLGAFPLDRGAGDRAALQTALTILERGEVLLMFPEGHRQIDDAVHDFMPGVGMIALRSRAPRDPAGAGRYAVHAARRQAGVPGAPRPRGSAGRPQRHHDPQQQGLS